MCGERFERCYRKYRESLLGYVMREIGEEYLAEDICQTVFERFYLNLYRILPEAEWSWLTRCAEHIIWDQRKSASFRRDICTDFISLPTKRPPSEDAEEKVVRKLEGAAFLRLIFAELKEKSPLGYEALDALYVREFSYEEAAELLQVSVSVLRVRVSRAKRYVNERYREEYERLNP